MIYHPTANSYFSGAGGLDIGLVEAGINILQSLEIEKNCIATHRRNFDHKCLHMDITKALVMEQGDADIMTFTYPCTHYSAIADVHNGRTGDELFLHSFRHIALKEPEAYVVENVPGMTKFPIVMEAMTKLPHYYINVLCPVDAQNWLPQRRQRLILIGTKKPFPMGYPTNTTRISLAEILEPEPDIQEVPQYVIHRFLGHYRDRPIVLDPSDPNALTGTLLANYGKDKSYQVVKDDRYAHGIRHFTVREYARLQGFPDWFVFCGSETEQYRQIGNAVAVPVGRWIGQQLMRYFN